MFYWLVLWVEFEAFIFVEFIFNCRLNARKRGCFCIMRDDIFIASFYVGIFHICYIVLFIFIILAMVYIYCVVRIFLLFVYQAGTSILPMIGHVWLLVLLLFPLLELIVMLTVVVHLLFGTWLRFGDFSFLLFGGLKKFVIGWVVGVVGIVVNLGWLIFYLFVILFIILI